ncbi:Permease of the drug/metabolite transporter (DMT) superfamily [Pseudomonas putida]|nr:Permease of the drug/metabolite transporter (DMT) superfamily [Pseudomonas putida]
MTAVRKNPDAFAFQVMLGLCLIWGCQQVLIKSAAVDIAPVMQAAFRNGIAALLVGLLVCWRGGWSQVGSTWRAGLLAGALFGLEFLFIAEGLKLTSAAHMSVFLYTAPIFTALGLHFMMPSERLRLLQWLGILLAFGGLPWPSPVGFPSNTSMDACCWAMPWRSWQAWPGARPRWWCAARACPRRRRP